eukprot:TRINITY_DN7856_c0_g2_i2.p1 TRINITY_DN7856_c0_g2~~TRINITY_DN7856_c0_g2_i2.p1  ORF type:complete len:738 (-),score=103.03 TRINITY_DN7856_c0_g2_i2:5-2218(-)
MSNISQLYLNLQVLGKQKETNKNYLQAGNHLLTLIQKENNKIKENQEIINNHNNNIEKESDSLWLRSVLVASLWDKLNSKIIRKFDAKKNFDHVLELWEQIAQCVDIADNQGIDLLISSQLLQYATKMIKETASKDNLSRLGKQIYLTLFILHNKYQTQFVPSLEPIIQLINILIDRNSEFESLDLLDLSIQILLRITENHSNIIKVNEVFVGKVLKSLLCILFQRNIDIQSGRLIIQLVLFSEQMVQKIREVCTEKFFGDGSRNLRAKFEMGFLDLFRNLNLDYKKDQLVFQNLPFIFEVYCQSAQKFNFQIPINSQNKTLNQTVGKTKDQQKAKKVDFAVMSEFIQIVFNLEKQLENNEGKNEKINKNSNLKKRKFEQKSNDKEKSQNSIYLQLLIAKILSQIVQIGNNFKVHKAVFDLDGKMRNFLEEIKTWIFDKINKFQNQKQNKMYEQQEFDPPPLKKSKSSSKQYLKTQNNQNNYKIEDEIPVEFVSCITALIIMENRLFKNDWKLIFKQFGKAVKSEKFWDTTITAFSESRNIPGLIQLILESSFIINSSEINVNQNLIKFNTQLNSKSSDVFSLNQEQIKNETYNQELAKNSKEVSEKDDDDDEEKDLNLKSNSNNQIEFSESFDSQDSTRKLKQQVSENKISESSLDSESQSKYKRKQNGVYDANTEEKSTKKVKKQQQTVESDTDAATNSNLDLRSEEHTSELQSRIRISYAVFCLKKKKKRRNQT